MDLTFQNSCALDNVSDYPPNKKGYKLFDIHAVTFFISRDVIYLESVFPYFQRSQPQSIPPLQDILSAINIDLPTSVQSINLLFLLLVTMHLNPQQTNLLL